MMTFQQLRESSWVQTDDLLRKHELLLVTVHTQHRRNVFAGKAHGRLRLQLVEGKRAHGLPRLRSLRAGPAGFRMRFHCSPVTNEQAVLR